MPWQDTGLGATFFTPFSNGPLLQTSIVQEYPPPASIGAGLTWDSGVIASDGYQVIGVGLTSAQAGSLVITRYLDRSGNVTVTTASTTSIVAATPLVVIVDAFTDRKPFASFRITASNTSGSAAAVTNFFVLMQAF